MNQDPVEELKEQLLAILALCSWPQGQTERERNIRMMTREALATLDQIQAKKSVAEMHALALECLPILAPLLERHLPRNSETSNPQPKGHT